jgi:hypothetical protein
MKFSNIKKDWWLANSVLLFILAAIIFIRTFVSGNVAGGLIIGGVDALLGVALLQRSKIAFWLVLVTTIYNSLEFLAVAKTDSSQLYSVSFFIRIAMLAFILMLWQQIRTEGKKSKT